MLWNKGYQKNMKNHPKQKKNIAPKLRSPSAMKLLGSFLQAGYGLSVVGDSRGESESACAAWSFYLINMSSRQSDRRAKGRGKAHRIHLQPTLEWSTAAGLWERHCFKLISLLEVFLGLKPGQMAVSWKFQQSHCLNWVRQSSSGGHWCDMVTAGFKSVFCHSSTAPRQPPPEIFFKPQRHFRRALLL